MVDGYLSLLRRYNIKEELFMKKKDAFMRAACVVLIVLFGAGFLVIPGDFPGFFDIAAEAEGAGTKC